MLVHRARGNDHGSAKRVPDEDDTLHAVLLQRGDPGQDIERTFGQDVGVPVAQPQGSNPFLTQRFREPRIGALTGPTEAPPGTPDPDHPVLRRPGIPRAYSSHRGRGSPFYVGSVTPMSTARTVPSA